MTVNSCVILHILGWQRLMCCTAMSLNRTPWRVAIDWMQQMKTKAWMKIHFHFPLPAGRIAAFLASFGGWQWNAAYELPVLLYGYVVQWQLQQQLQQLTTTGCTFPMRAIASNRSHKLVLNITVQWRRCLCAHLATLHIRLVTRWAAAPFDCTIGW